MKQHAHSSLFRVPSLAVLAAAGLFVLQGPLGAQCPGGYGPPPGGADSGGGSGGGPAAGPGAGSGAGPSSPGPAGPAPSSPGGGYGGPGDTGPRSPGGSPSGPRGGGATSPGPSPTAPGPAPGPLGSPISPLGSPMTPSAFDLGELGATNDPLDWQLWWAHNKDRFLTRERFSSRDARTSNDDFYLGRGQRDQGPGSDVGRRAAIDRAAHGALKHVLTEGGKTPQVVAALLSAAGLDTTQAQLVYLAGYYLEKSAEEVAAAAAFALGSTGSTEHAPLLMSLVRNDADARARHRGEPLPEHVRALAATGLGLAAGACNDQALRREVVALLAHLVAAEDTSRMLRVAAVEGLGLVPLPLAADADVCYCGACAREAPSASFQAQVTFIIEHVVGNRDFDPLVRAHAVTALGRLVGARLDEVPYDIKRGAVGTLQRVLDPRGRQPEVVRESAVLALGLVTDADASFEDDLARWALRRAARSGGQQERRFALMALAQAGSRMGQSEAPFAATGDVEKELLQHLGQGRSGLQPWAALSLGVLEHGLRAAGQEPSEGAIQRLNSALARERKSDRGAVALALGLCGKGEHSHALLAAFNGERDVVARAYLALALGLADEVEAAASLLKAVNADEVDPRVRLTSGLALGLLGSNDVVPALVEIAQSKTHDEIVRAVAEALGRTEDPRSAEALSTLIVENEMRRGEPVLEACVRGLGRLVERKSSTWRTVMANGGNYHARTPIVARTIDLR